MDKELTPKQQTSEAIRQAETILIMTGQHPSVDQAASAIALTKILRKFGKKVTAVVSDEVPAGVKFLDTKELERTMGGLRDFVVQVDLSRAEVDKLKYTIEEGKLNIHITPFSGGFNGRDVTFTHGDYQFDVVIVLGVASYARIDKVYAQNAEVLRKIPLINIDHHRANEQYGAINLVEPTAACLGEILIALSESLQGGLIDEKIATTMLTGIMSATDRFTANHTTSKTMTVAAQMMAMGADQQTVVRGLYRDKSKPQQPRLERSEKQDLPQQAPVKPKQPETRPVEQAVRETVQEKPQEPAAAPAPIQPFEAFLAERGINASEVASPAPAETVQPLAEPKPLEQTPPPVAQVTPEPPTNIPPPPKVTDFMPPAQSVQQDSPSEPKPEPAPQKSAPEPQSSDTAMEDLLPPQHIELSEPEPLINDTSDEKKRSDRDNKPPKGPNPTNNPVFAQRLDQFEY